MGQEYLPESGGEVKRPHGLKIKQSEANQEIATKEKDNKWSLKYDRCVKCGENDLRHVARGLCLNCYERESMKRYRPQKRLKHGLASLKMTFEYLQGKYLHEKQSLGEIAKEVGCSRTNVLRKIKTFNIPLRTQREARVLVYDREKIKFLTTDEDGNERLIIPFNLRINEDFFKSWSREMAYVLGVIYSDGNLYSGAARKGYCFGVSQKEPELLTKLLKLMDCNARLHHKKKRAIAGALYFFAIHHEGIYTDLINLGLSPNKSKTVEFPNMPQEFVRHFIRGCWDGDGSVYLVPQRGTLRASYVSGSLKFIERLIEELYKVGIYKIKPPSDKTDAYKMWVNYPDGKYPLKINKDSRSNAYYIKVDATEKLKKLFRFLYDGVDESMYLRRKYEVFMEGLKTDGKSEDEQLSLDLPF